MNSSTKNDNGYYIVSEKEQKRNLIYRKTLFYIFYLLVIVIGVISFYLYRIDKYEFYLVKDSITIDNGSSYQVELTPKNIMFFDYLNYKYDIVDDNIAKVDKYGNITGLSSGTTELKIKYKHSIYSKTMKVHIENIEVTSLNIEDKIVLSKGESYKITSIVNNQDGLSTSLNYKSSNPDLVVVDNYGNVTAVMVGEAIITVTSKSGFSKDISIVVVDKSEKEIESDKRISLNVQSTVILDIGSEFNLKALTNDNDVVIWSSSNPQVATVDNGKVSTLSAGTTTITAKIDNNNMANVVILVKDILIEESDGDDYFEDYNDGEDSDIDTSIDDLEEEENIDLSKEVEDDLNDGDSEEELFDD